MFRVSDMGDDAHMSIRTPGSPAPVHFDSELVARYGGRGPRYTSYPTALQFSDRLTASDYRAAAAASNAGAAPLSIYVHVPFCHSLCYYCGCTKVVTRNAARVARYVDALHREIAMQAELFDTTRRVVQMHFGGGTPTYLDHEQLDRLMAVLRRSFTVTTGPEREFSIEVDPRTVDPKSIRLLAGLGFNRLSLGIQDFDPRVQAAVNRMQSADEVSKLVHAARNADFRSISFDLIYGLPHQDVESFDRTLDLVVAMRPDRLAVYNYAHLPGRFKGQRMIDEADLPTPATRLRILEHTIARLHAAGYVYIGMDHFALPEDDLVHARRDSTLQRNFQGYSTYGGCDLIGLGVSAIGSVGDVYAQNAVTTMEYEALIDAGKLAIRKGVRVDADDALRASVIQSLMCYDRFDFASVGASRGIDARDYFAAELARLETLAADGLVEIDTTGVSVTPRGRLFLRNIAMAFDRYVDHSGEDGRYSKVI